MKNLIKLIKSDGWLMVIALLLIVILFTLIVLLFKVFPETMMIITIILTAAIITGALATVGVWYFLYLIEKSCDDDNAMSYRK